MFTSLKAFYTVCALPSNAIAGLPRCTLEQNTFFPGLDGFIAPGVIFLVFRGQFSSHGNA